MISPNNKPPSRVRGFPSHLRSKPWMLQGSLGGNPAVQVTVAPEGASISYRTPQMKWLTLKSWELIHVPARHCQPVYIYISLSLSLSVDSVVFSSQSRDDPIFRASKYAPWWFNSPTKVSHIKPETRNHQLLSGWNHHKNHPSSSMWSQMVLSSGNSCSIGSKNDAKLFASIACMWYFCSLGRKTEDWEVCVRGWIENDVCSGCHPKLEGLP